MSDFVIKLKPKLDLNELKKQLEIEREIKVKIDKKYLENQLQNIKITFDVSDLENKIRQVLKNYNFGEYSSGTSQAQEKSTSLSGIITKDKTADRMDGMNVSTDNIKRTTAYYDEFGQLIKTVTVSLNGLGLEVTETHDAQGKLISSTVSLNSEMATLKATLLELKSSGQISEQQFENLSKRLDESSQSTKEGELAFSKLKKEINAIPNANKQLDIVTNRFENLAENGKLSSKQIQELREQLEKLNKIDDPFQKQTEIKKFNQELQDATRKTMSFGQMLSEAFKRFAIWSVATVTWYGIVRAIKAVVNEAIELDTAFTGLQMVTGGTDQEINKLKQSYIDLAKEMKVTLDVVTNGAEEFLRAGLNASEATEALQASIVMSTVGALDSAESTQYLIATMNAFGLEANELMSVVDKMSAIDIVAATSTAELGEAMSLSANSAQLAGVNFDKYLAMIATVSETTRQSASNIGNSFRTLFSRLQKVNIGAMSDEDKEAISDADRVLQVYGIDLMEVTDNLETIEPLLDLLGKRWKDYTSAQQSEIATALAGTYQRERFLALMSNYDRVLELTTVSEESAGSAMEKYGIYAESTQAKIDSFKTSLDELIDTTLQSNDIEWIIELGQAVVELTSDMGGLIPVAMELLSIFMLIKGISTGGILGTAGAVLGGVVGSLTLAYQIGNAVVSEYAENLEEKVASQQQLLDTYDDETKELNSLVLAYSELASKESLSITQTRELAEAREELAKALNLEYDSLKNLNTEEYNNAVANELKNKVLANANQLFADSLKNLEEAEKEMGNAQSGASSNLYGGSDILSSVINAIVKFFKGEKADEAQQAYDEMLEKFEQAKEKLQNAQTYAEGIAEVFTTYTEWERSSKGAQDLANGIGKLRDIIASLNENMDAETVDNLKAFLELMESDYEAFITRDFQLEAYEKQLELLEEQKEWEDRQAEAEENQKKLAEAQLEVEESLLTVEEKRAKLAEARNKKIAVYRLGRGMVYEEDAEAVQSAQEELTDALTSYQESMENFNKVQAEILGTATEQAIKATEMLIEAYNKVLTIEGNAEKIRTYFQDEENRKAFESMSYKDQMAFWEALYGGAIEGIDIAPMTPEEIAHIVSNGSTNGEEGKGLAGIVEDIKPSKIPEPPKSTWDIQRDRWVNKIGEEDESGNPKTAFDVAQEYIDTYGMREGDRNRWGQDKTFLELWRKLTTAEQNALKGYHTGGIVGQPSFSSNQEMYAKLLKDEIVLRPNQFNDIIGKVKQSTITNETNQPIYIDRIEMNGINDVSGFINELTRVAVPQR